MAKGCPLKWGTVTKLRSRLYGQSVSTHAALREERRRTAGVCSIFYVLFQPTPPSEKSGDPGYLGAWPSIMVSTHAALREERRREVRGAARGNADVSTHAALREERRPLASFRIGGTTGFNPRRPPRRAATGVDIAGHEVALVSTHAALREERRLADKRTHERLGEFNPRHPPRRAATVRSPR